MPELRYRRSVVALWVAMLLIWAGCSGPWHKAPLTLSASPWSIVPPDGWMHLNMSDGQMLSKDGPYLEFILIQARRLEKGFRFTRQKLDAGMLPHEAAQLVADNLRSDPHIRRFRLLASEPAMVGGQSGFRLIYSYQDQYGVTIKTVYYGVLLPDLFFNLRYSATQRHYFNKELPTFNKVLESLRFVKM